MIENIPGVVEIVASLSTFFIVKVRKKVQTKGVGTNSICL